MQIHIVIQIVSCVLSVSADTDGPQLSFCTSLMLLLLLTLLLLLLRRLLLLLLLMMMMMTLTTASQTMLAVATKLTFLQSYRDVSDNKHNRI